MISKQQTVSQTCRELGIWEVTLARWREQALEGKAAALEDKGSRGTREDQLARQLAEAERTTGQLALDIDLLGGVVMPLRATRWDGNPAGLSAAWWADDDGGGAARA